jgi:hypothetical protein
VEAERRAAEATRDHKPPFSLHPLDPDIDAGVFNEVRDAVLRSVQEVHSFGIDVTRIYQVRGAHAREVAFAAARLKNHDVEAPTLSLFHGTRDSNVPGILTEGFRVSAHSSSSGRPAMFGPAVYLCPDSSKAAQPLYTGDDDPVLLRCEVAVGRSKVLAAANYEAAKACAKERFDSVYGKRGSARTGGVLFDEYAVYNPAAVLPRFVIHFRRLSAVPRGMPALPPSSAGLPSHATLLWRDSLNGEPVECFRVTGPPMMATDYLAEQFRFAVTYLHSQTWRDATGSPERPRKLAAVLVCCNPALERRFRSCLAAFARHYHVDPAAMDASVQPLFHGCPNADVVKAIMINGLKVGGIDEGVDIAHGRAYGVGVYTAESTATAAAYARGQPVLLNLTVLYKKSPSQWDGRGTADIPLEAPATAAAGAVAGATAAGGGAGAAAGPGSAAAGGSDTGSSASTSAGAPAASSSSSAAAAAAAVRLPAIGDHHVPADQYCTVVFAKEQLMPRLALEFA